MTTSQKSVINGFVCGNMTELQPFKQNHRAHRSCHHWRNMLPVGTVECRLRCSLIWWTIYKTQLQSAMLPNHNSSVGGKKEEVQLGVLLYNWLLMCQQAPRVM